MRPAPPAAADPDIRHLTAWHEAGHAVVAHLSGWIVTAVEVVGDQDLSGSVTSLRLGREREWTDEAAATDELETRILCLVAGYAAEELVAGVRDWAAAEQTDLNEAVRLSLRVVRRCDRVPAYLEVMRRRALDLLASRWPLVAAVAHALSARGRLAGDEFRAIVETHGEVRADAAGIGSP